VEEGKEIDYFWPYLGGKSEYATSQYLKWNVKEARLFSCSNTTGVFKVEEIFGFTQEDLDNDDVFILECFAEVYVWVGIGANDREKQLSMQTAVDYVKYAASVDGRDPTSTPIYLVSPEKEPLLFKAQFHAWEDTLKPINKVSAAQKLREEEEFVQSIKVSSQADSTPPTPPPSPRDTEIEFTGETKSPFVHEASSTKTNSNAADKPGTKLVLVQHELEKYKRQIFTFEELTAKQKPPGVDSVHLEKYLSDEDFQRLFAMSRESYNSTPVWKRVTLKKSKGLY